MLIREADIAFAPGLNAITGETGAGKTILTQAIGLLLGGGWLAKKAFDRRKAEKRAAAETTRWTADNPPTI